MVKTEIICANCDGHYIIVSEDESELPSFCPFCSSPIEDEE